MHSIKYALFLISFALGALLTSQAYAMKGDPCNAVFVDKNGNLRPDKVRAYFMHEQFEVYRKADTNCDGYLSAQEIEKFENDTKLGLEIQLTQQYVNKTVSSGKSIPLDKNGEPPLPIVANVDPTPDPCVSGWSFLLRDSAEDIGTFSCPKDFKTASGAQFGFSRDGISQNTSWSAKGVAALAYVWRNQNGGANSDPYIAGVALSPWVSFNRLTQSLLSQQSKAVDLMSYGGTAEVPIAQFLGGTQYFRAKTLINSNFEGAEKSLSGIAEWQPVSNDYGISSPNPLTPYLTWEIDPIARYVYSERRNGSLDPIFASHGSVSRAGPVLALTVAPVQNDHLVPHWLQASSLSASYEWLIDANTRQNYRLYNVAVNFPVDQAGHVGVKVNYQYGALEETGQKVNLITTGLSAKW